MDISTNKKLSNLKASNQRKQRSDKKTRVSPYFDDDTNIKLQMLATATGNTKAGLAEWIIRDILNNPSAVIDIQNYFKGNAPEVYKVKALRINGTVTYRLESEGY